MKRRTFFKRLAAIATGLMFPVVVVKAAQAQIKAENEVFTTTSSSWADYHNSNPLDDIKAAREMIRNEISSRIPDRTHIVSPEFYRRYHKAYLIKECNE